VESDGVELFHIDRWDVLGGLAFAGVTALFVFVVAPDTKLAIAEVNYIVGGMK
jgi:hypothetical protein